MLLMLASAALAFPAFTNLPQWGAVLVIGGTTLAGLGLLLAAFCLDETRGRDGASRAKDG